MAQAIILGTGIGANKIVFDDYRFPNPTDATFKFLMTLLFAVAGPIKVTTSAGELVELICDEGRVIMQLSRMMTFDLLVQTRHSGARKKAYSLEPLSYSKIGENLNRFKSRTRDSIADLAFKLGRNVHDQVFGREFQLNLREQLAAECEKVAPKVNWATELIARYKSVNKNNRGKGKIEKDLKDHIDKRIVFTAEHQVMCNYCLVLYRIGIAAKTLSRLVGKVTVEDIIKAQDKTITPDKKAKP